MEYFWNELLPVALMCGMTPNQFWYDEPRLLDSYIKKRQMEIDATNYNAWLFGVYTYKAMGTIMSNAFAKKGAKAEQYFDKPIEELNSTYQQKALKQKQEHRDVVNYWSRLRKEKVGEQ